MSGQGCTLGRIDGRAGVVAAREREAKDMVDGKTEWSTSRLKSLAETVHSVYIPSLLGRFFFKQKYHAPALKYLELARSRELNPAEQAKLDEEIAEVKAAMHPQTSA